MRFDKNCGRSGPLEWAARLAIAALALATTLVWGAPVSAFEIATVQLLVSFVDADGNVAFTGDVDCERTAASVKEGAEKPTTVFWTNGDLKGSYPYAALKDESKAAVDRMLARHAEWKKAVEKSAAKRKANWSKAPTLPLGFTEVRGKKVALVVGCGDDNADGANPASAADARLLGERLRECGFEVVLLTGQEATRSNIEGALKTLEEKAKVYDMIFVAFSGLGLERNGKIYCMPTDAVTLPVNDVFEKIEEICVSLSDFAQNLEKRTPSAFKAFFFDLCHSRRKDDRVDGAASLPANAWTLCACASGEFAYRADFDGKEHGIFSYCFAEGLTERGDANADGVVTLMEAFLYARAYSMAKSEIKRNALMGWALLNYGPVAYGPLADVAMRDLNAAPQEISSTVPEQTGATAVAK